MSQSLTCKIISDLGRLGIRKGSTLLVHSSYRSIGKCLGSPTILIDALRDAVGDQGNLLMPALSYLQDPISYHDSIRTPSNVGVIPELFRKQPDVLRSTHPTHSVCGIGPLVEVLFANHELDRSPCGQYSPFSKLLDHDAYVLMLGCGLRPCTIMHALEERVEPPYLFGGERAYTVRTASGRVLKSVQKIHGFGGWLQRYDRLKDLPGKVVVSEGRVLSVESTLLSTRAVAREGKMALERDPLYFVDKCCGTLPIC